MKYNKKFRRIAIVKLYKSVKKLVHFNGFDPRKCAIYCHFYKDNYPTCGILRSRDEYPKCKLFRKTISMIRERCEDCKNMFGI